MYQYQHIESLNGRNTNILEINADNCLKAFTLNTYANVVHANAKIIRYIQSVVLGKNSTEVVLTKGRHKDRNKNAPVISRKLISKELAN